MQIEGFWYYLFTGVFEAATIHYAVAKIFGPLVFGRGWCGYGYRGSVLIHQRLWRYVALDTGKFIRLSVLGDNAVLLSELDKQKREAILSAVTLKELYHKNTYCKGSFEGECCTVVLCTTDFGPIVRYSERKTAAENNMRPSTMEIEWCCFLKNDNVSYDSITNENWGDYAVEKEITKPIIIKKESGNYC